MTRPASRTVLTRRSALRAGLTAAASILAARAVRPALAQVPTPTPTPQPFDPGGRVHVTYDETLSFNELYDHPPLLGRVEARYLRVVGDPDHYGKTVIRNAHYSDVLPIYSAQHFPNSVMSYPHNDIWFDIGDGWIHSSWVVPVQETYNTPEDDIPRGGFWGQVTVPTSWQHWQPALRSYRYFDLAYSAIFRIVDRVDEPDGRAWYRIEDDILPGSQYWVQAAHVRRMQRAEFAPISPDVPAGHKRIAVSLRAQTVTCYEDDEVVFATRCATGTAFVDSTGQTHDFYTPRGRYYVRYKRPSRHMRGGAEAIDGYDLPGVPWCTFFTGTGIAIHGTYWHNDYGHPRSHGCVNVTPDAANWVYRWVNPTTPFDQIEHATTSAEYGASTRVVVAA